VTLTIDAVRAQKPKARINPDSLLRVLDARSATEGVNFRDAHVFLIISVLDDHTYDAARPLRLSGRAP
jgi:hypothetical protein